MSSGSVASPGSQSILSILAIRQFCLTLFPMRTLAIPAGAEHRGSQERGVVERMNPAPGRV
jgi:hypothetical protein